MAKKKNISEYQSAFNDIEASMRRAVETQKMLEGDLGKYFNALKDIAELEKNIEHTKEQQRKKQVEINDEKLELRRKEQDLANAIASGNNQQIAAAKSIVKEQKKKIKLLKIESDVLGNNTEELRKATDELKKAAVESNKLKATWGSMKGLGNFAKNWGFDKLKTYGVFEMEKEIRNAARSMNIGKRDFQSFANNISKASESTTQWGVGTKRLAMMQKSYSEEIGKSVQLTDEGYKSMALMAEGTGMGDEFATSMAASMDIFGGSAETAKQLVEDTMNSAGKMGVNGVASLKKMQGLLKLSQTYVFKGGIKGLKTMAADAARLKLDMEGIAGLADKVMRPEGAVETAALLTTMGGEFAKLGDPFQLMFKARNDFEGFAKDIGKASAEFVKYNEETKTFDINGGLARDRMKEISNITGIAMDKLQEMAAAQKKIEMIGTELAPGFTDEDKALIGTLSQIGKDGEITVKAGSFERNIKELRKSDIERLKTEQKTLEERAKQARTFAEVVDDLILTFQQFFLPVAESLKENIGVPLQQLMTDWKNKGYYESIKSFVKQSADFVTGILKFGVSIANTLGPGGILATWGALKAATWIANGIALGQGFKMVTSGMFGGGNFNKKMASGGYTRDPQTGRITKMTKMQKFGRGLSSGGAITGGLLAGGGAALSEYYEQKEKGSENAGGKALIKGLTTGLGAYGGMALGAALAPATGGLSLLLPLALGAAGSMAGGALGDVVVDDAIITSNSKNNGTRVQFNPNDKFLTVNDALIAGTNAGGNAKLAEAYSSAGSSSMNVGGNVGVGGTIMVEFPGGNEMGMTLAKDTVFMRRITEAINEQIAKNTGGGVTTSKPRPLNI